jgi:hypothetical protein
MATIDLKAAMEEFQLLKTQETARNNEYYLLRQAVKGNFRWPRDWPTHIPKVTHNLCKPVTERFVHYLMGKGFTFNVDRPNSLDYRVHAEQTEKILRKLLHLSQADIQFDMGAKTGSQLGRTIFKVYKTGKKGAEHACFVHCQPDYFYGVAASDDHIGQWSTVYYSYPVDHLEANKLFGPRDYKTEAELARDKYYDTRPEDRNNTANQRERRVPVMEVWTRDAYALVVGGIVIFNGDNPFKSSTTGEGFIPYVVIENIRNSADNRGESDIAQSRELNEHLNYLISRKAYVVQRYLNPTLVWEGAPQNYAEILAATLGGGGAIPTRIGSKLFFLTHDAPNPSVLELEQTLRSAILETAGMSDLALQGTVTGSVNTGTALQAQFQPILSSIEKKRKEWENGLQLLFSYLLEVQESIGDSAALGTAVINQSVKSENFSDGDVVSLSGAMIAGLRDVTIDWPGVLPKDDLEAARLEMEKAQQGFQSIYTTLEKLGEDYPDDEVSRIRLENQDPALRGQNVAEQVRAQTPLLRQQMAQDHEMAMAQQDAGTPAPAPSPDEQNLPPEEAAVLTKLRQLQSGGPAIGEDENGQPAIESVPPAMAGAAY